MQTTLIPMMPLLTEKQARKLARMSPKTQVIVFCLNSDQSKEFVKGQDMFPVKLQFRSSQWILQTSVRNVVDHLRTLGFHIPSGAIVSAYNQNEQAYEYLGRVASNKNNDTDIDLTVRPVDNSWQFCLNLKFRYETGQI